MGACHHVPTVTTAHFAATSLDRQLAIPMRSRSSQTILTSVGPDTAAARAGLNAMAGHAIFAVDGQRFSTPAEFKTIMETRDRAQIEFSREPIPAPEPQTQGPMAKTGNVLGRPQNFAGVANSPATPVQPTTQGTGSGATPGSATRPQGPITGGAPPPPPARTDDPKLKKAYE
eukprot:gene10312-3183_t